MVAPGLHQGWGSILAAGLRVLALLWGAQVPWVLLWYPPASTGTGAAASSAAAGGREVKGGRDDREQWEKLGFQGIREMLLKYIAAYKWDRQYCWELRVCNQRISPAAALVGWDTLQTPSSLPKPEQRPAPVLTKLCPRSTLGNALLPLLNTPGSLNSSDSEWWINISFTAHKAELPATASLDIMSSSQDPWDRLEWALLYSSCQSSRCQGEAAPLISFPPSQPQQKSL